MASAREVRCPTCGHAWTEGLTDAPPKRVKCPDCGAGLYIGRTAPPRRTLRFFWARAGLQFVLTIAVFAAGVRALAAGRTGLATIAIGSAVVFAVLERDDYAMAAAIIRDRVASDAD